MKILIPVIAAAFFVASLAGCGGGSGGGSASGSGADTFVAAALQVAASSPDDAEPVDVETIPKTMPEMAEPVAL